MLKFRYTPVLLALLALLATYMHVHYHWPRMLVIGVVFPSLIMAGILIMGQAVNPK